MRLKMKNAVYGLAILAGSMLTACQQQEMVENQQLQEGQLPSKLTTTISIEEARGELEQIMVDLSKASTRGNDADYQKRLRNHTRCA